MKRVIKNLTSTVCNGYELIDGQMVEAHYTELGHYKLESVVKRIRKYAPNFVGASVEYTKTKYTMDMNVFLDNATKVEE